MATLTEKDCCGQNIKDLLAEVGFPIRDYEFCFQGSGVLIKEKVSLYEAQKWLREEKKVEVNALWDRIAEKWYSYVDFMYYPDLMGIEVAQSIYDFYEEALSEGIKEAVQRLKEEEQL